MLTMFKCGKPALMLIILCLLCQCSYASSNVLVSIAKALQTEPQGYARISDEGVLHSLNTFGESIDRVKLEKTDLCSIMQHFPDLTQIEVHSLELLGKMRCDTDTSKEVKIREEDVAKLSSDLPQDAVEGAVPEKVSWFRERHNVRAISNAGTTHATRAYTRLTLGKDTAAEIAVKRTGTGQKAQIEVHVVEGGGEEH